MHFKNNFLLYTLSTLILIFISASFVRFVINRDYTVTYESECDPSLHSCFIGCEDDDCTYEYYYFEIRKNAKDLFEQCGENIIDCNNAYKCLPQNDTGCSLNYCDPVEGNDCLNNLGYAKLLKEKSGINNPDSI